MPDTKLNKRNLKEHLRKTILIYIVAVAAALLASNLLWMTTAPRVPDDKQVLIYLAGPWSNSELLADVEAELLEQGKEDDPELQEVVFEGLMFADPAGDYTGPILLMTRLSTGEGDAFLADENAMAALVNTGACVPLDEYYSAGWLKDSGLEPWYATIEDEETGESTTFLAGFKIDALNGLRNRQAFENRGAYLTVMQNGTNIDTTMKVLEHMVDLLKEGETP